MELTLEQALKKGIEAHKAGQIQEADRLYTAILKVEPKHPDANHNMGILAVGVSKIQDALPFFKKALEANPSAEQFWLSYIDALIKLDRLADAKALYDQAKDYGAKGETFDKVEQQLAELEISPTTIVLNDNDALSIQSNILDTLKLDRAINLAKAKYKENSSEEAKRIYRDILVKFPKNKKANDGLKTLSGRTVGKKLKTQDPPTEKLQSLINLYNQGQLRIALKKANELLKQFPNSVVLYKISGGINVGLKQFDAGIGSFKHALKIKPDYAEAYYNMGLALKEQGKVEEAIDAYKKAISIKPDYAEAYNNMGNVLQSKNDLEGAIKSYKQAVQIKPDFAEAFYNTGNALQDKGELKKAIESYKQAVQIKPDFAEVYNNMGMALKDKGHQEEAIKNYKQAIIIKPDYAEAYNNMGNALKGLTFQKPNPDLQRIITSMLDHKTYVRPSDISKAAISVLKFEAVIISFFEKYAAGDLKQSLQKIISDLSELPLLLKLMSVCPLADLELEKVLKEIRFRLLLSMSKLTTSPAVLKFQSALALQCFNNEYIYNQSDSETKALEVLETKVIHALSNGEQPSPQSILCLASYKGLQKYEWCDRLIVANEIEEVFVRQILEPKNENSLKSKIPALEEITDTVSSKVRKQYESNPYPRWVNLRLPTNPKPVSKIINSLNLKLFDPTINEAVSPIILIAGCGTGQHSIGTAGTFKNSKVLAVDLSLSSLAYAKRKTEELGIQNIEYMQADILNLRKLDRQFDIIESAGVLHHMNDPMAGWRELTDCLKQGGLMKIGLYSELGRQHIVAIRHEIKESGIRISDLEMRSFRDDIINSTKDHHKRILLSGDFYNLSTLRDLLFHVQEHRFSIPQIKGCLSELGLKFCGLATVDIVQEFKSNNTGADDPYDLDKWNAYEEANPRAFEGMYQFWCQKIG